MEAALASAGAHGINAEVVAWLRKLAAAEAAAQPGY